MRETNSGQILQQKYEVKLFSTKELHDRPFTLDEAKQDKISKLIQKNACLLYIFSCSSVVNLTFFVNVLPGTIVFGSLEVHFLY